MTIYNTNNAAIQHINGAGTYAAQAKLLLAKSGDKRTESILVDLAKIIDQICALGNTPEGLVNG